MPRGVTHTHTHGQLKGAENCVEQKFEMSWVFHQNTKFGSDFLSPSEMKG